MLRSYPYFILTFFRDKVKLIELNKRDDKIKKYD